MCWTFKENILLNATEMQKLFEKQGMAAAGTELYEIDKERTLSRHASRFCAIITVRHPNESCVSWFSPDLCALCVLFANVCATGPSVECPDTLLDNNSTQPICPILSIEFVFCIDHPCTGDLTSLSRVDHFCGGCLFTLELLHTVFEYHDLIDANTLIGPFPYSAGLASTYPEPEDKRKWLEDQLYNYNYETSLPDTWQWPPEKSFKLREVIPTKLH